MKHIWTKKTKKAPYFLASVYQISIKTTFKMFKIRLSNCDCCATKLLHVNTTAAVIYNPARTLNLISLSWPLLSAILSHL